MSINTKKPFTFVIIPPGWTADAIADTPITLVGWGDTVQDAWEQATRAGVTDRGSPRHDEIIDDRYRVVGVFDGLHLNRALEVQQQHAYTVILRYTDSDTERPYYIEHTTATTPEQAHAKVLAMAIEANDGTKDENDFDPVAVFEGYHDDCF